jgi:PAS domain S-box-containing protein
VTFDAVAAAQLRAIEALLGEGEGIVGYDRDHRIVHWGGHMHAMTGMQADEVLGRLAVDAFPFLHDNGGVALFREALAGKRVASGDRTFAIPETRRGGTYEARYAPLHGGGDAGDRGDANGNVTEGAIVGVAAVIRDVTAMRVLAEQLRETENLFRNMADASPVLLWMAGPDSLGTFFNQTWLRFTGRTLEQENGVGWAEGVHFEDFQRCMDTYERAFGARESFEMEYRLRRADGEYRWILDRGVPRFSPEGTFAGYIGSCVDITELKDVEAQLRRSIREREDFLSVASHELRTPLTTLLLSLQRLQRETKRAHPDDPEHPFLRDVERAVTQSNRLEELVQDLLDVSRLSSGRLELQLEPAELTGIVGTAVEQIAESARRVGSALVFEPGPPVIGRWDRSRLERVATNLLSNALKYGAGKPVRVGVRAEADRAILSVRDEGIGIDPADHHRIFGQFERAVSARNYSGFGLGLWIVHEIVRVHGGRVDVTSAPGAGAMFTVTLPLQHTL